MNPITITPTTTPDGRIAFDVTPLAEALKEQINRVVLDKTVPEQIEFNQGQAAELLGISQSGLCRLCQQGRGPRFRCEGGRRKYFLRADLIRWAESQDRYTSTHEFYEAHPELRPRIDELDELPD